MRLISQEKMGVEETNKMVADDRIALKESLFEILDKLESYKNKRSFKFNILDNAKDPHFAWDYISQSVCPTDSPRGSREYLAHHLMLGAYDAELSLRNRDLSVILGRMALNLMGKDWHQTWLNDYHFGINHVKERPFWISIIRRKLYFK